jgi:hypothetical protein
METWNTIIRALLTLVLLVASLWWLGEVAGLLSTAPETDTVGNVIVDPYQRSKDILLVVLPLLTTALGHWFGAAGKAKAEDKADAAIQQLHEVLDVGSGDLLPKAKENNPRAFGLPS